MAGHRLIKKRKIVVSRRGDRTGIQFSLAPGSPLPGVVSRCPVFFCVPSTAHLEFLTVRRFGIVGPLILQRSFCATPKVLDIGSQGHLGGTSLVLWESSFELIEDHPVTGYDCPFRGFEYLWCQVFICVENINYLIALCKFCNLVGTS